MWFLVAPWTHFKNENCGLASTQRTGLHANTNEWNYQWNWLFFFIPSLETYQKWASTLICCHHLWMPALLIFGIKVSSLCCLCGVGLLWSPDQRRFCPEMTLTESQATKETCFIYLVHTVYNTWLGLHRSDRLWHLLDWWGGQLFAAWQRLREGVLKKLGVLAVTAEKLKFN